MFCSSTHGASDEDILCYVAVAGILPACELQACTAKRPGAQPGKRQNIDREFDAAMERLLTYYFRVYPRYGNAFFKCRFRTPRAVLDKLFNSMKGEGIFVRRTDATKKPGIYPLQ